MLEDKDLLNRVHSLQKRVEFLSQDYCPTPACIDAGFKCDFEIDDNSGECPCEWAMSKQKILEYTKATEQ